MTFAAHRAGRALADETELRAYLASLLRLENIGMLIGAGASCGAGGKTMAGVWADFLGTSAGDAKWLLDNSLVDASSVVPRPPPGPPPATALPPLPPNVEELVDSLEIAIMEWTRLGDARETPAKAARAALFRAVIRGSVLSDAWWTSRGDADASWDGLQDHRAILQKLTSARQPGQSPPWVFTTNYDLAVEWSAESVDIQVMNGFLGLHGRRFSPQSFDLGFRNIQARGEARFGVYNIFLAKLHGSLTWKEIEGNFYELPAAQAWPDINDFRSAKTTELSYLVLPRAAKYLQTAGYVLGELFRRFAEFLARPQAALIVAGYGFGDGHINRLLRSALLNPTLQVVVYLPEFTGDPTATNLPATVRRLLSLQNPRLTVVGGGNRAFFSELAKDLPDPAVYDDDLKELERKLRAADPPASGVP